MLPNDARSSSARHRPRCTPILPPCTYTPPYPATAFPPPNSRTRSAPPAPVHPLSPRPSRKKSSSLLAPCAFPPAALEEELNVPASARSHAPLTTSRARKQRARPAVHASSPPLPRKAYRTDHPCARIPPPRCRPWTTACINEKLALAVHPGLGGRARLRVFAASGPEHRENHNPAARAAPSLPALSALPTLRTPRLTCASRIPLSAFRFPHSVPASASLKHIGPPHRTHCEKLARALCTALAARPAPVFEALPRAHWHGSARRSALAPSHPASPAFRG
ncbi:hypothetical protein DFH09DRAFT_1331206 [Mycena vulgaris]|nr:hypothetical protein DFH09DRAFT_1331206 [Mycena vulgaris]